MRDQVEAVEARGLYAGAVYSALPEAEVKESLREATPGDSKLLYVTPESLHDDELVARLRLAQEAGRDGELARCSLIYRPGDPSRAAFLSATGRLTVEEVARGREVLKEGGAADRRIRLACQFERESPPNDYGYFGLSK